MVHQRCSFCTKKMTLAGTFSCKCEKTFCSVCRYADKHACTHSEEIKKDDLEKLKDNLVQVIASKLEKI